MKLKLISTLLAATFAYSTTVSAECYMQTTVYGKTSGQLDTVTDVTKYQISVGNNQKKCIVTFRANAKNKWWDGSGEYVYKTSISENAACAIALEGGKKELVEQIFGNVVQSEGQMVCSDFPQPEIRKTLKIGDVVKLSEVQLMPGKQPFGYKGAECRWFVETDTTSDKDLYTYRGVVCNVRLGEWEIIDKY